MKKIYLCLAVAFLFCNQLFSQAVYRSIVTAGNWNAGSSWALESGTDTDNDGVPDSDDDVYIQAGHTITLTANAACKDLHISTGTTSETVGGEGVIALGTNRLELWGKLRCYFESLSVIPGANSTAGYDQYPFSGTGEVRVMGTTRALTTAGEWSDVISNPGTGSFTLRVDLNAGQTVTLNTNILCTSLTAVNGTLNLGTYTAGLDNGITGGNVVIGPGATILSSASGTNTFQRTATLAAGTLIINANGLLVLTGALPQLQVTSYVLSGTVAYAGTGNQTWANNGVAGNAPVIYSNVTLANTGIKTTVAGTNVSISGRMSVQGTATAALGTGSTLSYLTTASILEYAGSAPQTTSDAEFPASAGPANLYINNSNGVTLHAARIVSGDFSLTAGALTTTNTNLLTLGLNAGVLGSSNTSFVNGPLKKVGNTAFVFPVGKTVFGKVPLELSNFIGGDPANAFTVEYVRSNPRLINNSLAPGLNHISMIDYWNFENSGTGTMPTADVTLYWTSLSSNGGSVSYINEFLDLRVARYNSTTTAWDSYGGSVTGGSFLSDGSIVWPGVTMLANPSSPFSLASVTVLNPLPVSFNYLTVAKQAGFNLNLLEWKLSCGSNAAIILELQRAGANNTFSTIETINATVLRCLQPFNSTDAQPLPGTNRYRLKVTDANGKISYSSIAAIINSDAGFELVSLLPALVTNQLQVNIAAAKKTSVTITITDMAGRPISKTLHHVIAGSNMLPVPVQQLTAGVYYLTATTAGGDKKTMRFVKQ